MMRKVKLFKKQLKFINLTEREALFDAGIGSGKTKVGALWLAMMAVNNPGTRWMMVARDANQLRNATDFEFQLVLKDWCGYIEGVHYKRVQSPQLEYKFMNGSIVIGAGAHNYDSVFRGPSLSGILGDEVDYWKKDAYLAAKGRVRIAPELIRLVSSPKGFNFVWEEFYQNASDTRAVVNATAYDNPTLSDAYIDSLKSSYSPRLFEQEVMGKRLHLNVGAVYDEFKQEQHVRDCRDKLELTDQLYFFTDYNISNYCGIYMFFRDGTIYAIGEEHLTFEGTKIMAKRIKAKFPKRHIIVVGDSTGNNKRDVAIDRTNYQIFEHELGRGSTKNFHNPPVESRVICANSNFYHNKLVIDPSCKTLIKDLNLLAWKDDGSAIDKSDITLSHASDGYTYGVWFFLPLERKRKSRTILL